MRKRIAVFGGSLFEDIKIEEKKYKPTHRKSVINLSKYHSIDNFSYEGLTIERSYRILKALPVESLYDDCIIALGEGDLDNSNDFEAYLILILDYLEKHNIRAMLVSLPTTLLNDTRAIYLQNIIDRVALNRNIDYIYEGKTDKIVSYEVLDDEEMTKAILELC